MMTQIIEKKCDAFGNLVSDKVIIGSLQDLKTQFSGTFWLPNVFMIKKNSGVLLNIAAFSIERFMKYQ